MQKAKVQIQILPQIQFYFGILFPNSIVKELKSALNSKKIGQSGHTCEEELWLSLHELSEKCVIVSAGGGPASSVTRWLDYFSTFGY